MNYQRNLRKIAVAKRVLLLLCITAIVFSLLGGGAGYVLRSYIIAGAEQKKEKQINEQVQSEFAVFGAYDDRIITKEISLDWNAGGLDFIPLDVPMNEQQQEFLYYLCAGYNLDFSLVMAIIQKESEFQSDVISATNDYGLMQINQMNHELLTDSIGITDYLEPYQNMRAGCFILRKLFEKYQDVNMVLMAYNMGETGAARLWEQGIYSTEYTESVLSIQEHINEQLEGE